MDDVGREHVEELTLVGVSTPRSRRRRALWGALATVGLAAGALVVVSAGEDGSARPGLPVALGSVGDRDEGALAADAMLAWITYVAGDDLPALGGEAPAHRVTGAVDEAQVRALADALGVDGELVHEGQSWMVKGDAGTLEVYESAGAQWWYSSTTAGQTTPGQGGAGDPGGGAVDGCTEASDDVVTDCFATTVPTETSCTPSDGPAECITGECPSEGPCALGSTPPPVTIECGVDGKLCPNETIGTVPPRAPSDLPSEDEARTIALDLLGATGVDVRGADVTAEGPFDLWYVTVEPRLDGVPSGLLATVSVGPEGAITSAGGYLGRIERLGDYPVLDTRAAIERANAQQGDGVADRDGGTAVTAGSDADAEPPPAECEACDPIDAPVSTAIDCPGGDSDCGSGGVVVDPTTVPPCKVQPDGSEICEPVEPGITCPQAVPPADEPLEAPETIECVPPVPAPQPLPEPGVPPVPAPEPEPLEVVLVDAEPSLVLLPAIDGSTDAYLVPAYRFTDTEGGRVDLPAVADEVLTGPPSTDTTVPGGPIVPDPGGVPPVDPQPCGEVLVEEDASGTTHTVQPNPDCVEPPGEPDPTVLEPGATPLIGVGYYVEVDVLLHCNWVSVEFAGRWWWADGIPTDALERWSQPTEGGTLTLFEEDRAEFVGDAERTKVAELVPYAGTDPDRPLCA